MAVLADKEALIGRIVEIELAMFARVKAVEPGSRGVMTGFRASTSLLSGSPFTRRCR